MKMIEDFQKLEVQTDTEDNKSSMFHLTSSTEIQDFQKVEVQRLKLYILGFSILTGDYSLRFVQVDWCVHCRVYVCLVVSVCLSVVCVCFLCSICHCVQG
jgi:hypothetical protein